MAPEDRPSWDDERGRELVGKTVLLGLTFATAEGEVIDQLQRHGVVEHADPEEGIGVRLVGPGQVWNGELYVLPPDLRPFSQAAPGSYSLRSKGYGCKEWSRLDLAISSLLEMHEHRCHMHEAGMVEHHHRFLSSAHLDTRRDDR